MRVEGKAFLLLTRLYAFSAFFFQDLDWMGENKRLAMSQSLRDAKQKAMREDLKFLSENDIMDCK